MSQWFSRASRKGAVAVAALLLLAMVPGMSAEETPEVDPAMVDFYIAQESLTLEAPTSDETQSGSMLGNAATPALAFRVEWGRMTLEGPVKFETNMVATLWIEPEEASVIRQVRASVLSGEDRVAFGDVAIIGTSGESVFTEARKIQIGVPTQGLEIDGDIGLEFSLWATGVSGQPSDVKLLYGSTTHPSRLSVGVSQDSVSNLNPSGFTRTYYLDDESLTIEPPTGEESSTRTHGVTGLENLATSAGFVWGTVTVEEDLELVGDTTLTFWLTHNGDPAVARTIRPEVHIGDTTVTQTAGIDAWAFADGETYRFDLALDTAGMEIPAGTQIQVDFIAWSSNSDEIGTFDYFYGSTVHPAGLTFRAAGVPPTQGPGIPSLNLSVPENPIELSPGGSTTFNMTVENPEFANATIDWSASSDGPVTVEFPTGQNLTLSGEETTPVPVTIQLAEDAFFGSNHTVEVTAELDGVPVANLSLSVQVTSGTPTDSEDDPDSGQNMTTEDNKETEEKESLPGPGAVALLLVTLIGGVLARNRRTQQ